MLTSSAKNKSNIPPLKSGSYLAVCYGVIDLGEQYNEKYGNSSRKILIMWELPGEKIQYNGEQSSRITSKMYTNSLGEKAILRKDLISWREKDFTQDELKCFDITEMIDRPCMLSIVQSTNNGKTYSNVTSVMSLPNGIPAPKRTLDIITFDLDHDPLSKLDALPGWIVTRIKSSTTYAERLAGDADQEGDEDISESSAQFQEDLSESSEELPF